MTATAEPTTEKLRIGEVAELTGTTPRTIRYYEEIGLLAGADERTQGQHRCFTQADVERINEIVSLRDLLGLSLDQLRQLLAAQEARAELKREYHATDDPVARKRILDESLSHIATQLDLVRERKSELGKLEAELTDRRRLIHRRLRELAK
jgi:MerR family transcriptional regulator, repressor of the yfmOP operon